MGPSVEGGRNAEGEADEAQVEAEGQVAPLRVFSHGGGAQSIAVLVLAAQGRVQYDAFLFANVGEDSEDPKTLAYHRDIATPFAAEHGLNLVELHRVMRTGETRTLHHQIVTQPKSIPFPVRMQGGGFGNRQCTERFKIKVVARWTREHGATETNPAVCGIGISMDELDRATTTEKVKHQRTEYPLLDLRLSRADCRRIIGDAGLPQPPKSSCYFCPFRSLEDWRRQRATEPEVFASSVALERLVNEHRDAMGKDRVWFSSTMRPLDELPDQLGMFDESEATCDTFSCMT